MLKYSISTEKMEIKERKRKERKGKEKTKKERKIEAK
jgi:hypothetical protein